MNSRTASPRRPLRLLAALAVVVLLLHALIIEWMAGLASWGTGLKEMSEPLFTRVLEPAEPPPLVGQAAPPPPPPPTPAATSTVVAPLPAPAASAPEAAASLPPAQAATEAAPDVPAAPAAVPVPVPVPIPVPAVVAEARASEAAASTPAPVIAAAPQGAASTPPAVVSQVAPPASAPPPVAAAPVAAAPVAAPPAAAAPAPAATDPWADTWPADSRVTYKLTGQFRGGPLYGSARVQWLRQGSQYQARVELSVVPFGSAFFTSQGLITPTGLVPQAFEEARGSRRRVTRFNEREVVLHDGRSLPRPEGVQDMASQFIELGWRFRTGMTPTTQGTTLTLPLVRPGGLDNWTYDVYTREMLRTERMGELEVIRVTPRPYQGRRGTLASEIWFAPRLQYLPVRFKVGFGEEAAVDLIVESVEQR